jgi:hypothetical protein
VRLSAEVRIVTIKRLLPSAAVIACLVLLAGAIAGAKTQRLAVTGFALSPSTFAVAPPAPGSGAAGRTTIRFRLSNRATRIAIAVARRQAGRRVGDRCVKPTPKLRGRRACARYVSVGTISRRHLAAGAVSLRFDGRVGGRDLAPGRYRSTIVAVDRRRHRSRPMTAAFTVIRAGAGNPPSAPSSSPSPPPPPAGFPTAATTGVPAGWVPRHTTQGDLTITVAGTVLDGELVTGGVAVRAKNVTIRNSWVYGSITNQAFSGNLGIDYSGLLVEDTDIGPPTGDGGPPFPAILVSGYTMRRVHVHNIAEGPRVADFNNPALDPVEQVTIEDSLIQIKRGDCSHNDGIQGFGEPPRTIIRHNTIDTRDSGPDCTTGAIFIGNDNPDLITVENNLLMGGGYTMRIGGPGPDGPGGTYDHVAGNRIVDGTWGFGPVVVDDCRTVADWSGNSVVTIDSDYRITSTVRPLNTC